MPAIRYETDGPVAIVTIDRPEVANAIDRPTAAALARRLPPLRRRSESLAVAVLTGANGTFCAGADLKAMRSRGAPRASRVEPDGDGPVGPTRMLLAQARDRRRRGPRGRRRARARGVVRPARGGRGRGLRRLLPALGHPADGRRHDPPAAPDRPQPRARPDPHRPRRQRRGGAADGARQPPRPDRARRSPRRSRSPTSSRRARRPRCAATGSRRTSSGR